MEQRLVGNPPNEERQETFDNAIKDWHSLVEDKIQKITQKQSDEKLTLLDHLKDEENLQLVKDEFVTFHIGGLHTTSSMF